MLRHNTTKNSPLARLRWRVRALIRRLDQICAHAADGDNAVRGLSPDAPLHPWGSAVRRQMGYPDQELTAGRHAPSRPDLRLAP